MNEPHSPFGRGTFRGTPNGVARNNRPRPSEIRPRNDTFYRNKTPNTFPDAMPPRFRNQNTLERAVPPPGFCNPSPIPCPGVVNACLPLAPSLCSNEMTLQVKRMLGIPTSPGIPMQMHHPISNPTPPSQPQKAEVFLPPPMNQVDLSRPPGLPIPNGFRGVYNRSSVRVHTELDDSRFEDLNGPVVASGVISPPPPGAVPKAKLPGNKVVPRSPSTASSSLSEDPCGSSVVFSSDTTFTSVDTNVSNKVIQGPTRTPEICRRYMRGLRCFVIPCRYYHPPRPDRIVNVPEQRAEQIPAASHSVPSKPMRQTSMVSETKQTAQQTPTACVNPPNRMMQQTPVVCVGPPNQTAQQTPAACVNPPNRTARETPAVSDDAPKQTMQQTPATCFNPSNRMAQQTPTACVNPPNRIAQQTPVACDSLPNKTAQQTPAASDSPPKQSSRHTTAASDNVPKQLVRHTTVASDIAPKQATQRTSAAYDKQPMRQISAKPNNNLCRNSTCPVQVPQHAVKTSAHMGGPRNGYIPPKRDRPSSTDAEPPPKPKQLYATTISDHIKVRFDEGFEVREVVTGFESRWVHLGNISGSVTSAALNGLLAPYKADPVNLPDSLGKPVTTIKVQFASPADAVKAVTDLNGIELAGKTISAKSAINNSIRGGTIVRDTVVQLVWECPSRVGYVGYDTLKEAVAAMESINGKSCENLIVKGQLYEGLPCIGAFNVIFKHIPASMTEQGLRKFANSKSVMLGRPNYESLDKAVKVIRSRLEEYGTLIGFDLIDPPFRYGMIKAWAHYTTPAEAQAAQDDFNRRRPKIIGHTILSCRHVVSVSHVLSAAIYKMIREDIGWLRDSWHFRYGPTVSLGEKTKENADDCPVHIKITCDQSETLSVLKYEFEQMLRGQTITLENKPLWDDFLVAPAGRIFIAETQAKFPGIQIQVQSNRRVITLMGPITMRQRARAEIVRKISELKALQVWKIPLSGRALSIFLSAELSNLQELVGPENCMLDCSDRILVVRGNDEAFRLACSAIETVQSRQEVEDTRSDAICPVCFGEAIVPMSLACGHRWCRACLSGYLTSAVENKLFPLRCLGNDATCTQCIPLGLSRKVLSTADFNAVLEAAFWMYVHGRPDEFYHCPTPDCAQVYRAAPRNAVLQCPSCLVRICPACRIAYHDGMTCEERDVADDKLFKAWTKDNDVKSCPGCKTLIERSEGCNHMTCTRCQTHICWECLATFPRGQGIYDHMRMQHGGIGL